MKKLFVFCLFVAGVATANTGEVQVHCTRSNKLETNGYPFLTLLKDSDGYFLGAINDSGVPTYYSFKSLQKSSNHYILSFESTLPQNKACPEYEKCFDKIVLYLSKDDSDGFGPNFKTSTSMSKPNYAESTDYFCRHKNIEKL